MREKTIEKTLYYVTNVLICTALLSILVITAILPREIDLQISIDIGDVRSWFGILFAIIGEIPSYIILPLALAIVFRNLPWDNYKNKFFKVMSATFVFVTYFIWFKTSELFEILEKKSKVSGVQTLAISIVLAIVAGVLTLILAIKLNKEFMFKLYKWALFALVVVLVSFVLSRILKYTFSRPRFRNMPANGSYGSFTPWWKPNGFEISKNLFKSDNTSFPSGHTISASNILVFVVLFNIFPKLKKFKPIAYFISFSFILLTAISRIVNLAHFLSDVTFAALLGYAIFACFNIVFFYKKPYVYELQQCGTPVVQDVELVEMVTDDK